MHLHGTSVDAQELRPPLSKHDQRCVQSIRCAVLRFVLHQFTDRYMLHGVYVLCVRLRAVIDAA